MSRYCHLALLLVALLLLTACGGETATQPSPSAQPAATATTPPTPLPSVTPTSLPAPVVAASTATATPPPATAIPSPTPLPPALATAMALAPAQPLPVGHPGYAESPCSDKYPCNEDVAGWEARLRVPDGFLARYYAYLPDTAPTSITFGPDGLLYVATLDGQIFTVDASGESTLFFEGLIAPTAITFQPGTWRLFVSDRVINVSNGGESQISVIENGERRQIIGGLPCCYAGMHAAQGIAFGPDGYAYAGVGARADHGEILDSENLPDERRPLEAAIIRFSPDGSEVSEYAAGFRNPYDLAFDGNGQLYTTDNGPDFGPPDEFHIVVPGGEHGYPYYVCDDCFGIPAAVDLIPPAYEFPPHVSPTGLTTYLAAAFPGYYNSIFAVLWSAFEGAQKVVHFGPGGSGGTDFAQGFALPIDVTVGPDGNLYVADFATGIVFQISYVGEP